jgi:hypothetical protein
MNLKFLLYIYFVLLLLLINLNSTIYVNYELYLYHTNNLSMKLLFTYFSINCILLIYNVNIYTIGLILLTIYNIIVYYLIKYKKINPSKHLILINSIITINIQMIIFIHILLNANIY